jgi:serine/threonine-protein kinase
MSTSSAARDVTGVIAVSKHLPIPGYELLKLLGYDGHCIYLARQSSSGRLVYLNVVHSSGEFGRQVAQRLRRHAALLATLDHPNILRPVEVGDAEGYGFFTALEYAEGGFLSDKVRNGPLPSTEAASIARAIASALEYARTRGVVQVDLGPRSVLLGRGNVAKLADFRPWDAGRANARIGTTPGYMAPEEVTDSKGAEPAPATDVYRVGAVLYEMLTGQTPVSGAGTMVGTIRQVVEQSPVPVRQWNPVVPPDLEACCMRCLEKQPAARYADVGELVNVLDNFLAGNCPS